MVSIVTKKIQGKEYLYLVHSIRNGDRIQQKVIRYIGKKRHIAKEEFECMKMSFSGTDWILREYEDELSYLDHTALQKVSDSYRSYVQELDKVSRESERKRFLSIFIANSNAIEGSTMTPKDTYDYVFEDVIPKKSTKKELSMAGNMIKAWEYVEANFRRFPRELDLSLLHALVNRDIEEERTLGKYKPFQNYIGDLKTTSYLFVDQNMKRLMRWMTKGYRNINDFEVAFQSHAQFELIHPFIDGNGRVGRLLINWLLMHKGKMPLAIESMNRPEYLSALRNAQRGKIEAICRFCLVEYLRQYRDHSG
jgi:Fic family protein